MSDNTVIQPSTTGDSIRDIDRSGVKTQVVQLDFGGSGGGSTEQLATPLNPLPVLDGNARAAYLSNLANLNLQVFQNQFGNGFLPVEVPSIGA